MPVEGYVNKPLSFFPTPVVNVIVVASGIDTYFEEAVVAVDLSDEEEQSWVLKWWRDHVQKYPGLATAARDYVAAPTSELSAEVKQLYVDKGHRVHRYASNTRARLFILKTPEGTSDHIYIHQGEIQVHRNKYGSVSRNMLPNKVTAEYINYSV